MFLNNFFYDAAENIEIEMESMMIYMVEDDEHHGSGELSIVDEADIGNPTSTSTNTDS